MNVAVDTSVVMAALLNEPGKDALLDVTTGADLQSAPSLPWEVGNALSTLLRRGRIELGLAEAALASFSRIPIRLVSVDLASSIAIADEFGIYAYDAYVLDCALRHRSPLLSLDSRQCEVARQLGIEVIEVPE
jgi:predicted nucleic acid-binding protein